MDDMEVHHGALVPLVSEGLDLAVHCVLVD